MFCEKYQMYLEHINNPTPEMQAVEKMLDEQAGMRFIRDEEDLDHDEN